MKPLSFAISVVLMIASPCFAAPLGNAFTYQGQLVKNSTPYAGNADFIFRLWNASSGGTQVGGSVSIAALPVTEGLFTAELDFGAAFDGTALWLDVQVRTAGEPSYTLLIPRSKLTAAPYALRALSAPGGGGLTLPFSGTTSTTGSAFMVTNNDAGIGVHGVSLGGRSVFGREFGSGNNGYLGGSEGASGTHAATGNLGVLGNAGVGAYGKSGSTQNYGSLGGANYGAYGLNFTSGNIGYLGHSDAGARGVSLNGHLGFLGHSLVGVYGQHASSNRYGGIGDATTGAYGVDGGTGSYGYLGTTVGAFGCGVYGVSSGGWAGYFGGPVHVNGNFSSSNKFFRIDHPLDPENKYLQHSCVESDEMKNVYDGVATLDANGGAWVELPRWFESLNRTFRYQLTCIGEFAPVYVAQKVQGNRFQIAGGKPGMEISWMVTGVRQDAYAKAKPMRVEVDKEGSERGRYLHPEAFGLPEAKGVLYERSRAAHVVGPATTAGVEK